MMATSTGPFAPLPFEEADLLGSRYRLLQPIGSGGMSDVYEARHLMTGRTVALKYLRADQTGFAERAHRALQEAAACGAVRHRSVVDVLDGGWTPDGDLFLVFEHLTGRSLSSELRGSSVSPQAMVTLGLEVLSGLTAVHAAGWLHLDMKPGNILLEDLPGEDAALRRGCALDKLRIIDFGIAQRHPVAPLAETEAVHGTLQYMSPEQARGDRLDRRSDLWSVGAILYRILTGKPTCTPVSLEARVERDGYGYRDLCVHRPDLPLELIGIVDRALEVRPEQRWESAEAFAAALQSINAIRLSQLAAAPGRQVSSPASA